MFDQQIIRQRFIEYKRERKLTLEVVARISTVSKSTLSRFQHGKNLDAEPLVKIIAFLKIDNISGGVECSGDTLENIKEIIHADRHLSDEDKIRLWHLFEAMYGSLVE